MSDYLTGNTRYERERIRRDFWREAQGRDARGAPTDRVDKGRVPAALRKAVGVPAVYCTYTLKDFAEMQPFAPVLGAVRATFATQSPEEPFMESGGIVLGGATRTGKSSFSAAVTVRAATAGFACGWLNYTDFIRYWAEDAKLTFNDPDYVDKIDKQAEQRWLWEDVYEVLVIDDIEQESPPERLREMVRSQFRQLVRQRRSDGLYTVLSHNLDPATFDRVFNGPSDEPGEEVGRFRQFIRSEFVQAGFNPNDSLV